ncbi:MAG: AraC family transcriptional regulator [Rhodospirillaceae bacterium]|nr:MAG: AraC family transcriptional regulator [Rhodospirillaceae bacterium]
MKEELVSAVEHIWSGSTTVEKELCLAKATVQLVYLRSVEPIDGVLPETPAHRLELCLTRRPPDAEGSYLDLWRHDQFESIGDLYMVPAGTALRGRSSALQITSISCLLAPDSLNALLDERWAWTDSRLQDCLHIADTRICQLLRRLAEEVYHPGFASEAMAELITEQVIIELGRYCAGLTEAPQKGLAPWRLRVIEDRLAEVRDVPTLAELASLCRLSARHLTRGFRAARGYSLGRHIAERQLDHAKRLLATEQSIKVIARALGFASTSSFCYAFRRATDETPRQFQERERRRLIGALHLN